MSSLTEMLVSGKELITIENIRKKEYEYKNIHPKLRDENENDGWEFDQQLKKEIKMRKKKSNDVIFENEIWLLLKKFGFKYLNRDRNFEYIYGENLHQQIDVIAIDDETVILVECKCANENNTKMNFKTDLEAINGKMHGIFAEMRKELPNHKYKYIFATKNYIISSDIDRLNAYKIFYMDEKVYSYYYELSNSIGSSAKYQFLGDLFANAKIDNLDNKVPAIRGFMGNKKYYSFCIEPEKLLKFCYVLHRNDIKSYQRLIKKERLKQIQNFINNGGYFPNSIIINIDTRNGQSLNFDQANKDHQISDSKSSIGILNLPQNYKSAYVIDGQHRLYGYVNSNFENNNTIPVIAFENLDAQEQIKLFMEINENQKTVSKNLRNTLNKDLLLNSKNSNERRQAFCLYIAHELGENSESPLYNRIIIGEDLSTGFKSIKLETINNALKYSDLFNKYKGERVVKDGVFDDGIIDTTLKNSYKYIQGCFSYIKESDINEWIKSDNEKAIFTINNGIHALILIFNDIIKHLKLQENINPRADKFDNIIDRTKVFLNPLIEYIKNIDDAQRDDLIKLYGSGGKIKLWRIFQKVINEKIPEFKPEGIEELKEDNLKKYNEESYEKLDNLEIFIKKDVINKLKDKFGDNWITSSIPQKIYTKISKESVKYKYDNPNNKIDKEEWEFLSFTDIKSIIINNDNWSTIFQDDYTINKDIKIKGGKEKKSEWLNRLHHIYNQNRDEYSIKEDEYILISDIYEQLINIEG